MKAIIFIGGVTIGLLLAIIISKWEIIMPCKYKIGTHLDVDWGKIQRIVIRLDENQNNKNTISNYLVTEIISADEPAEHQAGIKYFVIGREKFGRLVDALHFPEKVSLGCTTLTAYGEFLCLEYSPKKAICLPINIDSHTAEIIGGMSQGKIVYSWSTAEGYKILKDINLIEFRDKK